MESPQSLLLSLFTFLIWMLASFLCHKLAKTAMDFYVIGIGMTSPSVTSASVPLIVTLVQMTCCFGVLDVTTIRGGGEGRGKTLQLVAALSHFLATWATNASLALTFASSTMAVKMLEPVSSALLQTLLLRTPLSSESWLGMTAVVAGAVLYVGNPLLQGGDVTRAVIMAVVSNCTLGVRNVAIKLSHNGSRGGSSSSSNSSSFGTPSSSPTKQLRRPSAILAFLSLAVLSLFAFRRVNVVTECFPLNTTHFLLLSLASGLCHVTYSYVSTNVVLRYMSVVSHALANILKRVLVVLLLYVTGRRSASLWNWTGLLVCTGGMLLYNRRKMTSSSSRSFTSTAAESKMESADKVARGSEAPSRPPDNSRVQTTTLLWLLLPMCLLFVISASPQPLLLGPSRGVKANVSVIRTGSDRSVMTVNGKEYVLGRERPPGMGGVESPVLRSNPVHLNKSSSDFSMNLRFGYVNWTDGKALLKDGVPYQPDWKFNKELQEFADREHLLETPFDTDGLSPYLTTAQEVIQEAKRVHMNLFSDIFRGKKYAVLFELASFENKGDAAITIAELVLLEQLGIKLLFYVNLQACNINKINHAVQLLGRHPKHEVVALFHGGGNIFALGNVDRCRNKSLQLTRGYQQVILSNSMWMRGDWSTFSQSLRMYCCSPGLTILLRDRTSLAIAQRLFTGGTRLVLAPDMAFQLGYIGRFASPYYDIIWQKRVDQENAIFEKVPEFPNGVSVFVWDWMNMGSINSKNSVGKAMNVLQNGLGILQQGRVLVTDRLHGHILSTLLGIPHVLLDNADQKLSSYHNTWTRGVSICRLTDNARDAVRLALELLEEYGESTPPRLSVVDINEEDLSS